MCSDRKLRPVLTLAASAASLCNPSVTTLSTRTLKRLGITRRKSSAFAHAQSDANRAAYREKLAPYDPRQLVFLDESSFDYAVCNRYKAWGHRGDRTWVRTIFQRGKRYSLLAASCLDIPMFACILESENMKKEDFYRWCEEVLIPNCRPFPERRSVIVMDNCSIHKPAATQALFEREGLVLIYLPAYSPDFNPIEKCFSKIKGYLKKLERVGPIAELIEEAVSQITTEDVEGYFRFSTYK